MGTKNFKTCSSCGADLSAQKRTKDQHGNYFCERCWPNASARAKATTTAVATDARQTLKCANCDRSIGAMEKVFRWRQAGVCSECHRRLVAQHEDPMPMAGDLESFQLVGSACAVPTASPESWAAYEHDYRRRKLTYGILIGTPLLLPGIASPLFMTDEGPAWMLFVCSAFFLVYMFVGYRKTLRWNEQDQGVQRPVILDRKTPGWVYRSLVSAVIVPALIFWFCAASDWNAVVKLVAFWIAVLAFVKLSAEPFWGESAARCPRCKKFWVFYGSDELLHEGETSQQVDVQKRRVEVREGATLAGQVIANYDQLVSVPGEVRNDVVRTTCQCKACGLLTEDVRTRRLRLAPFGAFNR